jgi:Nif-specific regulatory protein
MHQRLSLLVDLSTLLAREVDFETLLGAACERITDAVDAERATIWLIDAENGDLFTKVAMLPEAPGLRQKKARGIAAWVAENGETVRVDDAARDPRFDPSVDKATGFRTRTIVAAPIRERSDGPVRGVLQVLNRRSGAAEEARFDDEDMRYVEALAEQLGRVFSLTTLRPADKEGRGLTLRGPFNRIVGRSSELAQVYERIQLAAQTDATVLLTGETGTGKGLFSRAIHVNSGRQAGPFVTVDCTTLPGQLFESEVFGHERGAFTGADRKVPGRVETAEGGTLFIDEIGELPLELQKKLLRLMQDRAYERVGGRETLRADIRVVCATHRDLAAEVRAGRFREDLYYRIRVVEIAVPPLRVRGPDEITELIAHFSAMYARRYGRPELIISPKSRQVLVNYGWPGNVRELEHWVESAIVLSPKGQVTEALLPSSSRSPAALVAAGTSDGKDAQDPDPGGEVGVTLGLTLSAAKRAYVEATLSAADGNKTLACKKLGISRNTLARILDGDDSGGI